MGANLLKKCLTREMRQQWPRRCKMWSAPCAHKELRWHGCAPTSQFADDLERNQRSHAIAKKNIAAIETWFDRVGKEASCLVHFAHRRFAVARLPSRQLNRMYFYRFRESARPGIERRRTAAREGHAEQAQSRIRPRRATKQPTVGVPGADHFLSIFILAPLPVYRSFALVNRVSCMMRIDLRRERAAGYSRFVT